MNDVKSLPVIVLAFSNDRSDKSRYLRNLPEELRQLRGVLQSAVSAELCEVVELANATADDIFSTFQSRQYRGRIAVFHYGGHAGAFELLLESDTGHAVTADATGLAKFLGEQNSLQLVFLNGCSTQKQTTALLNAGVAAVVSTSTAINDHVATQLATRFYRAIAAGAGMKTAFNQASAAAETESGGSTRALYAEHEGTESAAIDRFPWDLYFRPGAETVAEWNLPDTVDNPLFGLPPLPKRDLPTTPYRHLQWFRREHADVFFGRGGEIRELYHKATNSETAPVILFYGQSGVGKSSLLDAGLIPRLEATHSVIYLRRDGEQGLAGTMDLAFLPEGVGMPPGNAWHAREAALNQPLTIILDQLEEVFTRPCGAVSDELGLFLDHVNNIFADREQRPQGRLILGFRKEWLAEVKRQLNEFRLPYTEVFLERLSLRGVREVVTGPVRNSRLADQYQLSVEPGLAEQIADDLLEDAGGSVAPTLQILLSRMWEETDSPQTAKRDFTRELYASLRRQGLLLRHFLTRQLNYIENRWPDVVSPDLLLDLLSLHTTALGTAEERDVAELQRSYAHHADTLPEILEGCKTAYLLTTLDPISHDAAATTRLAHDTLGPLVRERFEKSDHPGQRARRILENRAVEWLNGETGLPLDDVDLSIVEAGRNGMRAWTDDEQRLVSASQLARSKRQRLRTILKSLGTVLIASVVVAAAVAVWYAKKADENADIAVAERILAVASEQETKKALARSLLLPLGKVDEEIVDRELDALWTLASTNDPELRINIFREALSDPTLAIRASGRTDVLVRAAVGLNPKWREQVLDVVTEKLTTEAESVDDAAMNWRTTFLCARIMIELRGLESSRGPALIAAVVSHMEATRDPRILDDLSNVLLNADVSLVSKYAPTIVAELQKADLSRDGSQGTGKFLYRIEQFFSRFQSADSLSYIRENAHELSRSALSLLLDRIERDDAPGVWQFLWNHRSYKWADDWSEFHPSMIRFGTMTAEAAKTALVDIRESIRVLRRHGHDSIDYTKLLPKVLASLDLPDRTDWAKRELARPAHRRDDSEDNSNAAAADRMPEPRAADVWTNWNHRLWYVEVLEDSVKPVPIETGEAVAVARLAPHEPEPEAFIPEQSVSAAELQTFSSGFTPPNPERKVRERIAEIRNGIVPPNNAAQAATTLPSGDTTTNSVSNVNLSKTQQREFCKQLHDEFLGLTNHMELATFVTQRCEMSPPLDKVERDQMLRKLAMWLYRPPPPRVPIQGIKDAFFHQENVPGTLAEAMERLIVDAPAEERILCAHSIMRTMLMRDFSKESGPSLQHALSIVIARLSAKELIPLVKSPWCHGDAQVIVMTALDKDSVLKLDHVWAVIEHQERLGVTNSDLTATVEFPENLHYNGKMPDYLPLPNNIRPLHVDYSTMSPRNEQLPPLMPRSGGENPYELIPRP